jgi:hypothetical protein
MTTVDKSTFIIDEVKGVTADYDNQGLFAPRKLDVNWVSLLQSCGIRRFKWVAKKGDTSGRKYITFKATRFEQVLLGISLPKELTTLSKDD